MERKTLPQFTKQIEGRKVTGIFAVHGNIDDGWDMSVNGSFAKRLMDANRKRCRFLWNHNGNQPPIATILNIREVGRDELPEKVRLYAPEATGGVEVTREYYEGVDLANWVLAGLKAGDIEEMSYAYDVHEYEWKEMDGKNVRIMKDVELFDISDVNWGMNPATAAVKRRWGVGTNEAGLGALIDEQIEELIDDTTSREDILREVAEKAGRSVKAIGELIAGNGTRPSDTVLQAIAEVLPDVTFDQLVSLADEDAEKRWLPDGLKFSEHAFAARAAVRAFADRARAVNEMRAKDGRVLSTANRNRIKGLLASLHDVAADLQDLLDSTNPDGDAEKAIATAEAIEALRLRAKLMSAAS